MERLFKVSGKAVIRWILTVTNPFFRAVVPHITDCIQQWVKDVSVRPVCKGEEGRTPDVCIIEMGGTIGDIEGMPFVEAFRQFQFTVGRENFFCVHVSLVPEVCGW